MRQLKLPIAPSAEPVAATVVSLRRFPGVEECTMPGESPQAERGKCTQLGCRYHLLHREYHAHRKSSTRDCALDVANEGEHTLIEVAEILGMSREWVRQLEDRALRKLRTVLEMECVVMESLRKTTFEIAREHAKGKPLRVVFTDSLSGDIARLHVLRRLKQSFPRVSRDQLNELVEELLTP